MRAFLFALAFVLVACDGTTVSASEPPVTASPEGYWLLSDAEQIEELCEAVKVLNGGLLRLDACFTQPDDSRWTSEQIAAGGAVTTFALRCLGKERTSFFRAK